MKSAVIYARYSSDSQTEQSIEGQLNVCQEYAQRNNIVLLDTYIDRAMTGTNDNRPDFQRMIKDSAKREWDYVIVYKLDRFSRDRYAAAVNKHTLKENGVKLISAMENIPDTPEGIILESLLEGMNQYYSAELAQKVKRGMIETRKKGNFTGGTLIYGYKIVDRKVVIDEDKAEVVRYIFTKYSQGVYVKAIISALTEKGIVNRGKPFAKNTIHNILKNEKYSGVYRYGEETFTNIYPQIVPTNIFEAVRAKSKRNLKGSRSPNIIYLLRGKVKCGYCNRPMNAECGTSSKGIKIRYYKCQGRKEKSGCMKKQIRKDALEELVINTTIKVLSKKDNVEELIDGIMQVQQQQLQKKSLIAVLMKDKKKLEKSLDNLVKAIEKGVVTNTTTKRITEVEKQIEDYERKILIEQSKISAEIPREEVQTYIKEALKQEPRALIELLIRKVKLYDDKIEICHNYTKKPKTESLDESQGFSFYKDKIIFDAPNTCSLIPKHIEMDIELKI